MLQAMVNRHGISDNVLKPAGKSLFLKDVAVCKNPIVFV